jgi:hypothetical protein
LADKCGSIERNAPLPAELPESPRLQEGDVEARSAHLGLMLAIATRISRKRRSSAGASSSKKVSRDICRNSTPPISGPGGIGGSNGRKAETSQVEGLDKGIDDANRIALTGPILQAFRQQRRLSTINALDEPRHARPRRFSS